MLFKKLERGKNSFHKNSTEALKPSQMLCNIKFDFWDIASQSICPQICTNYRQSNSHGSPKAPISITVPDMLPRLLQKDPNCVGGAKFQKDIWRKVIDSNLYLADLRYDFKLWIAHKLVLGLITVDIPGTQHSPCGSLGKHRDPSHSWWQESKWVDSQSF